MSPHSLRARALRQLSFVLALASTGLVALASPGCSADAASRGTCETVERARCAQTACFASEYTFGAPGDCAAYAVDACRGGTTSGVVATADQQKACTSAITSAGAAANCAAVRSPATLAACAFLATSGTDAGHD
jgi:hypothetical protein